MQPTTIAAHAAALAKLWCPDQVPSRKKLPCCRWTVQIAKTKSRSSHPLWRTSELGTFQCTSHWAAATWNCTKLHETAWNYGPAVHANSAKTILGTSWWTALGGWHPIKGSEQVLVPNAKQQYVLQATHEGHQGRDKCRLWAKCSV